MNKLHDKLAGITTEFEEMAARAYERASPEDRIVMDAIRAVDPNGETTALGMDLRCKQAARAARASLLCADVVC